jgi:hypothetical protein
MYGMAAESGTREAASGGSGLSDISHPEPYSPTALEIAQPHPINHPSTDEASVPCAYRVITHTDVNAWGRLLRQTPGQKCFEMQQ